ncbi:MAG: bifunctional demethylmenaquinone methyltransferase/2-methoxy-6-polyprenyl-1,4-benzoquinol methylase UbiE [Chlorobi bacterium]|nr:bifunctional demethylmenaquinone methyltransferase/2-methoxy-6-polyprenyl-1,4-benzoquinol methylase UbiE [Chlorobiota bacterium]
MTKPKQQQGKKEKVKGMFNAIAFRYDFLNHFLSAGIDKRWRKKVRKHLAPFHPYKILDVATGTGDLAIELAKLQPEKITGIDIATGMLDIGKEKISKRNLENIIFLEEGDSENLQSDDKSFDAVTVAFGVRNFENLERGLSEMFRVLKPGGHVVILEFSKPKRFPFRQVYNAYFRYLLPAVGKMISKNKEAYTYLPESVQAFPEDKVFLKEMEKAGFKKTGQQRLTFGIATMYYGTK